MVCWMVECRSRSATVLAFFASLAVACPRARAPALTAGSAVLVIGRDHPGSKDNQFGYEGGSALRVDGLYHLFLSEMYAPPLWDGMRFGHWTSADRIHWTRASTVFAARNAWSPVVVWDDESDRWFLFYVQYRWNHADEVRGQYDGTIVRLRSATQGRSGIGGPFEGRDIVMEPNVGSASWEGGQGVDSFFPYRVGDRWYALYGSHNHAPAGAWLVGLATGTKLTSTFRRMGGSVIESFFIENPIVTRDRHGSYLGVYDSDSSQATGVYVPDGQHIGISASRDGLQWSPGANIAVLPAGAAYDVRTPVSLIEEGDERYTTFFTVQRTSEPWWDVYFVELTRR